MRHLVCCINHHRPLPLNTATLLPVVYRIWLKNIATMVDVDSLHLRIRRAIETPPPAFKISLDCAIFIRLPQRDAKL